MAVLVGTTIRLKGNFTDFDGQPVEATDVHFTVYDNSGVIVVSPSVAPTGTNWDYYWPYIVPDGSGELKIVVEGTVSNYPQRNYLTVDRINVV